MAMKPSHIIKGAAGFLDKAGDLGGLVRIVDMASDIFKGREPTAKGDGMNLADWFGRLFHGVLGKADERKMATLLLRLDSDWRADSRPVIGASGKGPNPAEVLVGFFEWHFPTKTWVQRGLKMAYGNGMRSSITLMSTKVTVEEPVTSKDEKGKVTTSTKKTTVDDDKPALDFLRMMVHIIVSEGERTKAPKYLKGYKKLLAYLRALGYPTVPDGAEAKLQRAITETTATAKVAGTRAYAATQRNLEGAAERIEEKVEEKRSNRSFWAKLGSRL